MNPEASDGQSESVGNIAMLELKDDLLRTSEKLRPLIQTALHSNVGDAREYGRGRAQVRNRLEHLS